MSHFPIMILVLSYAGIVWFLSHEQLLSIFINIGIISVLTIIIAILIILALSNKNVAKDISNYALLMGSIFVTLFVLEGGFRVYSYQEDLRIGHALENLDQTGITSGGNIPLIGMIRFSRNPRIIYEFIPNISVMFQGQLVTTNSDGFRNTPYSKEDPNDKTIHIVGLGDSIMFGWGVKDHETYLSYLAKSLNQSYPDSAWKIINTGVPGYNTVMEVETLKDRGLHYKPDLVVIEYVYNDWDLPDYLYYRDNYFSLKKSYFMEFLSRRLQGLSRQPGVGFIPTPTRRNPEKVPGQYKALVGKEPYVNAMQELKALSIQHNFHLVLISFWAIPDEIKEICVELDIPTIEVYEAAKDYLQERKISEDALTISKEDWHPSALGHQIISTVLFEYLQQHGILQEIMKNTGVKGE